jgi:hypothetical protein
MDGGLLMDGLPEPGSQKDYDIGDIIAEGDVKRIIKTLMNALENGYDRLHWDGYDSEIHLYKSEPEPEIIARTRLL